jgi:AcrR family transcriptional regulator
MAGIRGGRPRDTQIDSAILEATRQLLATGSYSNLSMESVAACAQVGKKTLYRRWSSKASLVAEAVLDAYGRGGSFDVPNTGNLEADLRSWLTEHAEFIADPINAALIRALIAAAAARPMDNEALSRQLSVPQHSGLMVRLRTAVADTSLRADTDLDAIANALIGTLLLRVLNTPAQSHPSPMQFDGLLNALLHDSTVPHCAST